MSFASLVDILPNYAHDLKINLTNVFLGEEPDGLTTEQLYGVALTAALAIGNEKIYNLVRQEAKMHLEPQHLKAAKYAAMMMSLYNTYHYFSHNQSNDTIRDIDPAFDASSLMDHGIDKVDFEMNLLAASIIYKCGYCVDFHTKRIIDKGIDPKAVTDLAKVAAVLQASSHVLQMQNLRSYDFMASESNF